MSQRGTNQSKSGGFFKGNLATVGMLLSNGGWLLMFTGFVWSVLTFMWNRWVEIQPAQVGVAPAPEGYAIALALFLVGLVGGFAGDLLSIRRKTSTVLKSGGSFAERFKPFYPMTMRIILTLAMIGIIFLIIDWASSLGFIIVP